MQNRGLATGFPDEENEAALDEHIVGAPFEALEALMDACFSNDEFMSDDLDPDWIDGEDPFDDDVPDKMNDDLDPFADEDAGEDSPVANLFRTLEAEENEAQSICFGCGATWEQIATDERAGCSRCYATFRVSLLKLLEQVQRDAQHVGKTPRAAFKRRLRLEQLRQRRDNQLAMLRNRLAEAVRGERYEEAATLRDKIKVVSSSLF